jgi:hypothetical protein
MSFKIFTLQLTGKFKTAEKIESQRFALEKSYKEFLEAEQSQQLAEYLDLEGWIKSGAMQASRKDLENQVFKGSQEYNQWVEFATLKKSKTIKNYFLAEGSPDLGRFSKIKDSAKLKEFYELKDYAEGGAFQQEKREIESHKFQGSAEEKHLDELNSLKRNRALKDYLSLQNSPAVARHQKFVESAKLRRFLELKNLPVRDKDAGKEFGKMKSDSEIKEYFRFEKSRILKNYREISGSHMLDRYLQLVNETGTAEFQKRVAFLKDKGKLEKSEAWKKYQKYKTLAEDPDIRFYLKYEKSPLYINYLDTRDSFDLQRYKELSQLVASPVFLKRKAWLEDKKKWEKSEDFKKYQRYLELKKDRQIDVFFKYKESKAFDFLKSWEVSFMDDFENKILDQSKWIPNSYWADKLLGDNFSQPGDLQAYSGGKNCLVSNSKLHIQVKKEKFKSRQWQPTAGFIPTEYNYTSDRVSTVKSFWQEGGIFEAKILFKPVSQVVSSCHLQGEKNSPLLTLLEMGPNPRMGVLHMNGSGKPLFDGISIHRLKPNCFYLFRLEWEGSFLTWKINDIPVYQKNFSGMEGAAHLNLTSLVIDEVTASGLPVNFEIDWIKCYRKKQ